jgi:acetyl-CoA synthetase
MTGSSTRAKSRPCGPVLGWDGERWNIPKRYNMAVDVADHHAREAIAMIYRDHTGRRDDVTWGQVQDRSRQIASHLVARGVRQGDRVAVLLPVRPDTAAAYLGVLRTGAILVTMSLLWGDEQISYRLDDCGAAAVLCESGALSRIGTFVGHVIDIDDPAIPSAPTEFVDADTGADDPALIFYTSGTTGLAKGVVHAHRTLLGHNEFVECHDLKAGDVFFGAGEWAFSIAKLFGPLRLGATQVVYRPAAGLDPARLLAVLSEHRVTTALLNPSWLRKARLEAPDAGKRWPMNFRVVCSSNEPLTVDLIEWFEDQFAVEIFDYYGSTESYPLIGNRPAVPVKRGSVGRALPGWEVGLLDEKGNDVADGECGEICLRANSNPQYPLGYWNRPQATAETFGGPWYRTKDQATRDPDGYFWVLGRTDDVIKTSGYRVGPYEVEAVLREHHAVQDAGVVGVADGIRGQRIEAFVELRDGVVGDEQLERELIDHVKTRYSRFAYPRRVVFVECLPRSATSKVQRAELRRIGLESSTAHSEQQCYRLRGESGCGNAQFDNAL